MNKHAKQLTIAALAMGAIGYLAGILTAPKSGKETRQDIKNTATKAKIEVEKKLKTLYAELSDVLAAAKKRAAEGNEKVRKELEGAIKTAQYTKEKVRNVLSALHEGDAEDEDLSAATHEAKEAISHLKAYLRKNEQE